MSSWFTLSRHDILDKPETTVGLSTDDAEKLLNVLVSKLQTGQEDVQKWDLYYRGKQPLSYLHPEVALLVGDRLKSMILNWPRLTLDSLEERLDVEGFRFKNAQTVDETLAQIWQANDFDQNSSRTHLLAMRHGRSFVSGWSDPKKSTPKLAVESARQMTATFEPGMSSQIVASAAKSWTVGPVTRANLYLPDRVVKYKRGGPSPAGAPNSSTSAWTILETVDNPLGIVPVVPFLNRYDLDMPDGESELTDVAHVVDAINKLATDMMVTSEFHAMPRRWATGIELQSGSEGLRTQEEAKRYWENATAGKVWLAGKNVTFGQFAAAELANFVSAIGMLTANLAAIAGLPPHYVGINTDNPASADAIRSAEASLIKRAQRKQRSFGESWEDVATLALTIQGDPPAGIESLETVWADPATPTLAEMADAAIKLESAGLIDVQQGQEDLGYSANQIARMQQRRLDAISAQMSTEMKARITAAKDLAQEFGMDFKDALAAVGLITPPKGQDSGPEAPPPLPPAQT